MNAFMSKLRGATLRGTPEPSSAVTRRAARATGVLLIAVALLAFAPVLVLGSAIGWPASLRLPAAQQLSLLHAHGAAVTTGYGLYLLYSLLLAPTIIGLAALVLGGLQRPLAVTVVAFAALSALARAIGILRWLTVMPALATAHAGADAPTRAQIELVFTAVTLYGGGIGEVLGVSLLMAAAVGTLSAGALTAGTLPRPLGALGLLVALLLAALALPAFTLPAAVPGALAVTSLSVWMLACGLWLLWRR
jgi:hypothetical protein